MRIILNQSYPVMNDILNKSLNRQRVTPKFSFKYYDSQTNNLVIDSRGEIGIFKERYLGFITSHLSGTSRSEYGVLDTQELFAVKWSYVKTVDDTKVTANITCLIHSKGKISFYYDYIPIEIEESRRQSKINHMFMCGTNITAVEILVPEKWIKTGTLVEYEVIGKICSKYNSIEICQNTTTLNITCIWCEKANACIESNDEDTHHLKVNDCQIKNMMTTEITEENKQNKSPQYLYIVIPLVVSLFVICIGCIIWRWMYKRKRNNE
ncbi:hypothetical protein MS3_00009625 [Schistosoma haematobium]|uniref:Egg protein CP391S-like protein n=1 Tax=Schistosoma haematobium TaxID=6185 RepID=A0A922LDI0_SCHHA|nr:hypothetical protein MS3_00009625 [Schistosoma haematobium]KAH9579497.1 hypothetical protein MS3_00009625 [Schistosoma haematobium]